MSETNQVFFVGEVTLYMVEIEGRGGDSVHDEYFKTEEGAVLASAVDGGNNNPTRVNVMKLSNGRYMEMPQYIYISPPPDKTAKRKLRREGLEALTPVQKALVARRH